LRKCLGRLLEGTPFHKGSPFFVEIVTHQKISNLRLIISLPSEI
jgi:hypothetical protein